MLIFLIVVFGLHNINFPQHIFLKYTPTRRDGMGFYHGFALGIVYRVKQIADYATVIGDDIDYIADFGFGGTLTNIYDAVFFV